MKVQYLDDDFDEYLADENLDKIFPVIKYRYLNTNKEDEYSFLHANFKEEDYKKYFKIQKEVSKLTIKQLLDNNKVGNLTFKLSTNPSKRERELLEKYYSDKKRHSFNEVFMGHFHLYEKKTNKGEKFPVIHFFMVKNELNILLFDAYHSIHPTIH